MRNMITGAAQADAALLLVDAAEGMREQTRRHARVLQLLGVRQLAVVVNKMDRVGYAAARFAALRAEILAYLASLDLAPAAVIPVSARHGDGVATRSPSMDWYDGATVVEALDAFAPARPPTALPLRLPVQAVYKFDDRRIIAGRIESGRIAVGDEIVVAPSGRTARVRSIEAWPVADAQPAPRAAGAGRSIGITLDQDLFVARGDVLCTPADRAAAARRVTARIFWLHDEPLGVGAAVTLRIPAAQAGGGGLGAGQADGVVVGVRDVADPGAPSAQGAAVVAQNHIAEVEIVLAAPIAADTHEFNPRTGRIVLGFAGRIAGGGLVLALDAQAPAARVPADPAEELAQRAAALTRALAPLPVVERLVRFRAAVAGPIVFTTSFGLEDQVLLHHLVEARIDADVVTLDTGRLFPETYA